MNDKDNYFIKNKKSIASHLGEVKKNRCLCSVKVGVMNHEFLTPILNIDEKNDQLTFDISQNEQSNQAIQQNAKLNFSLDCNGIAASFSVANAIVTTFEGSRAYTTQLPEVIFWRQRREYFRVKIPMSHNGTYIELPVIDKQNNSRKFKLDIVDMGIQGIGVLDRNQYLTKNDIDLLNTNKNQVEAILYLNGGFFGEVTFEIRYIEEINLLNNTTYRIGCLFYNLAQSIENQIQRYIRSVELSNISAEIKS